MLFMAPGLVFIIPGEFLLSLLVPGWFSWFQVVVFVFYGSRSGFYDSRCIFIVINGLRLV